MTDCTNRSGSKSEGIKVSALISVYNSDQYIAGCLSDLTEQTLFKQGALELLFIDCDSPGSEYEVIRAAQKVHPNIVYIRWPTRVTLYEAWNIAARYARGEFLTNANTDDRHAPDGIERHLNAIVGNQDTDLVYGDVFESSEPNQPFLANPQTTRYCYRPFFAPEVLHRYQFGCQPLWRRSLHDRIGYFNPTLRAAGDYDFNIRFNLAGCEALHISEPLGSFLHRTDSLSTQDSSSGDEATNLRAQHINRENILALYQHAGWDIATNQGKLRAFHDLALKSFSIEMPWHPGQTFMDAQVAFTCLTAGLQISGENPNLANNLAVLLNAVGKTDQARQILESVSQAALTPTIRDNLAMLTARGTADSIRSALALSRELNFG